jgi:glutamate carboxypeptidase
MRLLEQARECGNRLGLTLSWRESGGVSDGNRLAAAGLPVIDSMGVRGGEIHSEREFLEIESLTERAGLAAMMMMRWATGETAWPKDGI